MECLNCKEVFESSNRRKVFCSGKCKVAHHRKNGKKEVVTIFQLRVLYNELLDIAQKISGKITEQPQKVYDAPKPQNNFQDEPKQWEVPEMDNLQKWKAEINNCENIEELNYVGQRISSSSLSRLEQTILTKYGKHIGEQKGFI